MKRKTAYASAAIIILAVAVSGFATVLNGNFAAKKPFYLGVTYSGVSTSEAHELIDRVKNYTNLFVIQSGPLQTNVSALEDIGDYAVDSGLDLIVYMSAFHYSQDVTSAFLNATRDRWGNHFLGLYFGDEPGGKMLDAQVSLTEPDTGRQIQKDRDAIRMAKPNSDDTDIAFFYSGIIELDTTIFYYGTSQFGPNDPTKRITTYYPNGTITVTDIIVFKEGNKLTFQPDGIVTLRKLDGFTSTVTDRGNISQFEPYQQLWDSRPIQTYNDAAQRYENDLLDIIGWLHNQSSVRAFTSDYSLYWFDYKGGYDTVLAQIGPSDSSVKEISLVRGAANMQGKDWGTVLTWISSQSPALLSGDQMYSELKLTYEQGGKYAIVFNYAPEEDGVGLLGDDHFAAIERFWNEIVQNPKETNNVSVGTALVLPANYGWGMRSQTDSIWGIWQPDNKSPIIWNVIQNSLTDKNRLIDIVFDDPAYSTGSIYQHIYYWNQTA